MSFSASRSPVTSNLCPTPAGTQPSPSACSSAVFAANPLQCIGSTYVGAGRSLLARKSTVGSMRGTRSVPARCSPPMIYEGP